MRRSTKTPKTLSKVAKEGQLERELRRAARPAFESRTVREERFDATSIADDVQRWWPEPER